jgi:hypothetical protein
MSGLKRLLQATTLAAAAGLIACTTVKGPETASTNTARIKSGVDTYNYLPAQVDSLVANNGSYVVLSGTPNTDIIIKDRATKADVTLNPNVLETARLVPTTNSTIERGTASLEVKPHEEVYFLANVVYDELSGQLGYNTTGELQRTRIVVDRELFPSSIKNEALESKRTQFFDAVEKQAGYNEFNGKRFIAIEANNPFGGANRAYVTDAVPFYTQIAKPGNGILAESGVIGNVYMALPGREIARPEPAPTPVVVPGKLQALEYRVAE